MSSFGTGGVGNPFSNAGHGILEGECGGGDEQSVWRPLVLSSRSAKEARRVGLALVEGAHPPPSIQKHALTQWQAHLSCSDSNLSVLIHMQM